MSSGAVCSDFSLTACFLSNILGKRMFIDLLAFLGKKFVSLYSALALEISVIFFIFPPRHRSEGGVQPRPPAAALSLDLQPRAPVRPPFPPALSQPAAQPPGLPGPLPCGPVALDLGRNHVLRLFGLLNLSRNHLGMEGRKSPPRPAGSKIGCM